MKNHSIYPIRKQLNLPEIDAEILQFWAENQIFQQSIDTRAGQQSFTFYEGPPSANGNPGIHHVMARTIKDMFCRFKTLQGYQVNRKAGWDTHGLPVELQVEKAQGITKADVGTKISIAEYNQLCREDVLKFKHKWDNLTTKMGYWVDLDHPYITFENHYIESVWSLLKKIHEKGYLYKGHTIQPYSPAAGTGLSSHEINLPGCYKLVKDTSCVAQFKIQQTENEYFLAWTTTPWTLAANSALAVGKNIVYVKVRTYNPYTHQEIQVILAKARVQAYFQPSGENADFEAYKAGDKVIPWQIIEEKTGEQLKGIRYEQLLDYIQPDDSEGYASHAFQVIIGDFVSTEDGTGIVHISPTFGSDDQRVAKQNQIPSILVAGEPIVDKEGKYIAEMGEFAHRYVKDYKNEADYKNLDVDICIKLKTENKAFKVEKYEHNYPHCWRTDKPILYYPLESWFIKTTAIKDRLVELNRTIHWKPESTGTGRFGNWLENLVDWNLSRSRYWGIPLPIWKEINSEKEICVGSIQELRNMGYILTENAQMLDKEIGSSIIAKAQYLKQENNIEKWLQNGYLKPINTLTDKELDLHKPLADLILLIPDTNKKDIYIRELDLIDVWFDSGSMPYAQWHYPFENEEVFKNNFPADFIAEGVDQTRGWFFTLHVIAVMVFDSVAYKNVIANGLLLDKSGQKMSKSKGNVVDPFETIQKYGADATRWYLIRTTDPWENLKFDMQGLQECLKDFFGTLFNTYNFFAMYANLDSFSYNPEQLVTYENRSESDRWILSKLHHLIQEVTLQFNSYEPTRAARAMEEFLDIHLSNWYVRLNRKRYWRSEMNTDKQAAYETLFECLTTLSQLISPIAPFFSEYLWQSLTQSVRQYADYGYSSIHLSYFPQPQENYIDTKLEDRMAAAQKVCSLLHSIRKKEEIKVRIPLSKAFIPVLTEEQRENFDLVKGLIQSETNVKEIVFLTGDSEVIVKKAKANFKILGPKFGAKVQIAAKLITELGKEKIEELEKKGTTNLTVEGKNYEITHEEVEIRTEDIPGWSVASDNGVTVALDITLTDELICEGTARELVNRIQNIRKERNFNITDKISIELQKIPEWQKAVAHFQSYILTEVLATEIILKDLQHFGENFVEIEINDEKGKIKINQIQS